VTDPLPYDDMVETALRGVVREALVRTVARGLGGDHHFFVTFRTDFPGVAVPDHLRAQYPEEMTIVLQHQFWDLKIADDVFSVTLSFKNRPERLSIPLQAITAFADPSVKFALQFRGVAAADAAPAPDPKPAKDGAVVALDAFRKK
jgi:uncharacterized protein